MEEELKAVHSGNQASSFPPESDTYYMELALEMARKGLKEGEVPVGCIFVHKPSKKILAKSHNTTNVTRCVIWSSYY